VVRCGCHARVVAELKTRPNDKDVEAFIASVPDPAQSDCRKLLAMLRSATGTEPVMRGESIVGFGSQHYRYASGREGDWFTVSFSPRARSLTLYLTDGVDRHADRLERLGRHHTGKGCLYVTRLDDIDRGVLAAVINDAAGAR
jgi:hypothetical protein